MAIFYLIHVLATHFNAAFFANNGNTAFKILIPNGGGIVKAANGTILKFEGDQPAVIKKFR